MKITFASIIALLLLAPCVVSAATEVTTSRLYLINPDPADIQNSLDGLEAAIKTRGDLRPSKKTSFVPAELPDKLGEPELRPINVGPMTVNLLGCGNSYGQIDTASSNNGGLGTTSEHFIGCVHLSKRGIRISIVLESRMSTSDGLMGSLLGGIRDTIRGDDKKFGKKSFDAMISKVREKVPGVLVELIEVPGGEVLRPDTEKIKAALSTQETKLPEVVATKNVGEQTASPVNSAVSPVQPGSAPIAQSIPPSAQSTPSLASSEQRIQLLRNLAELKKTGILTEREFMAEKQKILGK
jgi:hypothetical protein